MIISVRYGGTELPSTSAIVGGVASVEAVKLLTGMFIPINNTYIYNGLSCTSSSYEM